MFLTLFEQHKVKSGQRIDRTMK